LSDDPVVAILIKTPYNLFMDIQEYLKRINFNDMPPPTPATLRNIHHYRFSLISRDYQEFAGMCAYHQTSPESMFTQKKICTIFTTEGRVTLSNSKLIITRNTAREELEVSEPEMFETLHKYFGIVL
jgi:arylamine N-acetyltransferase